MLPDPGGSAEVLWRRKMLDLPRRTGRAGFRGGSAAAPGEMLSDAGRSAAELREAVLGLCRRTGGAGLRGRRPGPRPALLFFAGRSAEILPGEILLGLPRWPGRANSGGGGPPE